MSGPPEVSVDRILVFLALHHRLRPGDPILRGDRFVIAHGGNEPGRATYLLLDRGHIVQRRTIELDPAVNRRTVGGYVGSRYLRHHIELEPHDGLVAEVEDETTREVERLKLCVAWPGSAAIIAPVAPR